MNVIKSFKIRIYPNKEQINTIQKTFTACRFVYNKVLKNYKNKYTKTGKQLTKTETINYLKELKNKHKWLEDIDPIAIEISALNVNYGYYLHHKIKRHPPKFKSKHNQRKAYTTRNRIEVIQVFEDENKVYIPKLGSVKAKITRPVRGRILNATISTNGDNKYYVSVTIKTPVSIPRKTGKKIGLDLGIKDLIITSEGEKIPNLKLETKYKKKIKIEQKKLYKKQKHSKNWEKQRIKISKIYKHIHNKKLNYYHNITTNLVKNYDIIAVETLKVNQMIKEPSFSQKIHEAAWSEIIRQLEYKCKWNDKKLIKINPYFPSSKICSVCGNKYNDLQLNQREWTCLYCNTHHDRDVNAAKNILNEALRTLK